MPLALNAEGMQRLDAKDLRDGLWKVRVKWTVQGQEYFLDQPVIVTGADLRSGAKLNAGWKHAGPETGAPTNMELWTAFLLGFVGSAHCAGMCGPLALALPGGGARATFVVGRLLYNLGRIMTYVLMGAFFGLLGQGFALAGLQRWVSLVLGVLILIGLFVSPRFANTVPVARFVSWLKSALGQLLQRRALTSLFGIGLLNGLLPCGLVYVACAGATATGSLMCGVEYMIAFGLGTVPMMLAISLVGTKLQFVLRLRLQRLIPVSLAIVGALLLLRGMALDIPYLSPKLPAQPAAASSCH